MSTTVSPNTTTARPTLTVWSTTGSEFVAAVISLGAVSLIGLAGNALVVAVISIARRRRQKSAVQLFLLHLAVSDLMVCLLCIPLTLLVNFSFFEDISKGGQVVCKITRFIQFLAPTSSICILTAISIDRFYSLVKPLRRKSKFLRPRPMLMTAWIYAAAIFLPTFYFAKLEKLNTEEGERWYCATIPNNIPVGIIYLLFLSITAFVIPLITMIVLYVRVGKTVWSRQRKISRSANTYISKSSINALEKSRKRVTRMLLTVVAVFLVCWAPFVIYTGFIERWVASFPNPSDAYRLILYSFGLFNSTCNPFIYYFSSGDVRKESMKYVCLEAVVRRATMRNNDQLPNIRVTNFHPKTGTVIGVDNSGNEVYDTRF